jgi:uncharacterized repeat protein (TIGR01451 family)
MASGRGAARSRRRHAKMTAAPLSLCRRRRGSRGASPRACVGSARRALVVCAAALLIATSAAVSAQFAVRDGDKELRVEPVLEKLVESKKADGAVRYELAPAVVTASGEQFVLTLRFGNATGTTIDGVRITSAIPAGLRYVPGSATGPGGLVLFSVDGGRTFGTEQELAARQPAPQPGDARSDAYTHVRWVLEAPLEAGATGFVRLRASSR